MPKEVPAAAFRQPSAAPSTTDMAAFIARAASPPSPLAVVPPVVPPSVQAPAERRDMSSRVTSKSATIVVPIPPAETAAPWRSKTVRRADGRELRKQTFYLDASISQRLAQHCAKYHYEQSTAVERAILALLEACGD